MSSRDIDQIAPFGIALVFALLIIGIVWSGSRTRRRLDAVGGQLRRYAEARGLVYSPIRGGYQYGPGIGSGPTVRGQLGGVEIEIGAHENRNGRYTTGQCAPPEWFPSGGGASIARRGGGSWFTAEATPTGDAEFDAVLGAYVGPAEATQRLTSAEVRRAAVALASFPTFNSAACYNAHGNRTTVVTLDGHVGDAATLDAAVALVIAITRT